jgi:hypothetical protein
MPRVSFSELPDDARLWIFAADRNLDDDELDRLTGALDRFVEGWVAHGAPVVGGYEVREGRFVLVASDERATGVSGCSIDALHRALKELEGGLGVRLTDRAPVWFRDAEGRVRTAARSEFREMAQAGEVSASTPVFDPTLTQVGEVRAGGWERPAGEGWHARLLPEEVPG